VAPRFLIDENLSPMLAPHLSMTHGFDAVHVNEVGSRGASDQLVLAFATEENRIVVTSNEDDFRTLARHAGAHPGLAILVDAVGRQRQIEIGTVLAMTIGASIRAGETAREHLFEIDSSGRVRSFRLPCGEGRRLTARSMRDYDNEI
jgi:predicted nuclease of predicted toxin-antitoxin system